MRQLTFQRVLGSGAFGSVYLAELLGRRGFRRQVAVKVLLENHPDGEVFVARVRDEARLLGLLQDEHILKVLELVRVQGRDAVMMEFVEGVDLAALISATEPPPPRALAELGASVAGALHAAHNARHPSTGEALNVIHRDVKPANVMVTDRGGVKLLDFGIAQARFAARESKTGQFVLGTLNYMAPEYIITGEVRPAADIYGLALALWEAAAGEVFGQPKLKADAHAKRVDERLAQIGTSHAELVPVLRQMLSWDPSARPDGLTVERQMVSAADLLRGTGLRSWAGTVVPRALEKVRQTAKDTVGLVGQVVNIADEDSPVLNALGNSGGKPEVRPEARLEARLEGKPDPKVSGSRPPAEPSRPAEPSPPAAPRPPEPLPDEATLWGVQRPAFLDSPSTPVQSVPVSANPGPAAAPAPNAPVAPPYAGSSAGPASAARAHAPPPYSPPGGGPPAPVSLSSTRSVVPGLAPDSAAASRSGLRTYPPPVLAGPHVPTNATIMPPSEPERAPAASRETYSPVSEPFPRVSPAPVQAPAAPLPKAEPSRAPSTAPVAKAAPAKPVSSPATRPPARKPQGSNIGWIVVQGLVAGALVGMFLVITGIVIFALSVWFG